MRKHLLITLATTTMAAACQAGGTTVTDGQRAEIAAQVAQTIDSLFAAMNVGDVDAITSHYRKSDQLMSVTVAQDLKGWEAFSSVTRSFYQQHPDEKFQHRIVQTQVLAPNVAAVTMAGSATSADFLMWTDVLVREEGRWVITLEHESWPGAPAPSVHPAMEPQGGGG